MSINFNVPPYFDDFKTPTADGLPPADKYHKVLFRPSYAVQARELTQLQSILQNQITKLGHHLFVEGSLIIPGHVSFSSSIDYVKVDAGIDVAVSDADNIMLTLSERGLEGKFLVLTSDLNGNVLTDNAITAKIIKVVSSTMNEDNPAVLYIQYVASSITNNILGEKVNISKFKSTDALTVIDALPDFSEILEQGDHYTVVPEGLTLTIPSRFPVTATGKGSLAFIEEGVYFIKGNFVKIQKESIVVDSYSSKASADIGLRITESVISSAEDSTLNDNASGTPNFAAPGAHRYEISTRLKVLDINTDIEGTDDDFILLCRVDEGIVKWKIQRTDYAIIEEEFARRTFDESGNYTVRPFHIDIAEDKDNTNLLQAYLEPSKAYVQGYEIETLSSINVPIEKARAITDISTVEDASVSIQHGNYILVKPLSGNNSAGVIPPIDTFAKVELMEGGAGGSTGRMIGFARVKGIQRAETRQTAFGVYQDIFKLYLFDIDMNRGYSFKNVNSFKYSHNNRNFGMEIVETSARLIETNTNSLVYELPYKRVKSCTISSFDHPTVGSDFNYRYKVSKKIDVTAIISNGVTTINGVIPNSEKFAPYNSNDWILEQYTQTAVVNTIPISSVDITITGSVVEIKLSQNVSGYWSLIAPVIKNIIHKTKTKEQGVASAAAAANLKEIPLDKIDVYQISKVYEYTGTQDLPNAVGKVTTDNIGEDINDFNDITHLYKLNTGQTDNYYGTSSAELINPKEYLPINPVIVEFLYFKHGAGDFFTVDSYPVNDENATGIAAPFTYSDIPSFNSSNQGKTIELRSAVDFRQDKSEDGLINSGECPHPNSLFETDLEYYLPRKDIIIINSKGDFKCIKGVSSLTPTLPETPSNSMVLYNLHVPAYTFTPSEVQYEMIDNKRYTMRDIGKIQKRVDNLEYYTSLSLLESEASNKIVVDSDGFLRSKAGFVVDSFNNHSVGNTLSPEYRCSVDRKNRTIRPIFHENSIGLQYVPPTSEINPTVSSHVRKTGDIITLPWSPVELFSQGKASSTININPYDVFTWTGSIKLSPSQDDWKDTTHVPELVVNQTGIYDAMMSIIDATDALGTDWNEWETTFFGSESTSWVSASGGNWQTTTTETKTEEDQARDGILTVNNPFTNYTELGERVIEIGFAPFVRGRRVSFSAERLKPNTIMYPFIDSSNISEYTVKDKIFVDYSASDDEIFNQMVENYGTHPFDTEMLSPMFYPDKWNTNSGKGIHPYRFDQVTKDNTDAFTLYNDGGNYPSQENSILFPNTELRTDAAGRLTGSFWFPNDAYLRFKTGTRTFRLSDSPISSDRDSETSFAQTQYHAKGLLETKENLTIATKLPMLSQTQVFDERTLYNTTRSHSTRWWDPLAQSFLIDIDKQPNGACITSVDLYFAKKATTIPVVLQIREIVVGLPSAIIVPHSTVTLYPEDINVDPDKGSAVTKFEFESPVYLSSGKSYAFVIFADTIDYEVWMARTQEIDVVTDAAISKNVFAGVLFKSQNGSTWSPDHNADLKFTIHRAKYDISRPGNLVLVNRNIPKIPLKIHPFITTKDPLTELASPIVKVFHKNHGFIESSTVGSYVSFTGLSNTLNSIPANKINELATVASENGSPSHRVFDVTQDSYSINLNLDNGELPTLFGIGGGLGIEASENYAYNTWYNHVAILNLPVTNTTWGVKTTQLGTLGSTFNNPYIKAQSYKPYVPNTTINEDFPKVIASPENQFHNMDINNNVPDKSFEVLALLTSESDYVSPVIDLERCSVVAIQNRIGDDTGFGELNDLSFVLNSGVFTNDKYPAGTYRYNIIPENKGIDNGNSGILNLSIQGQGELEEVGLLNLKKTSLFETGTNLNDYREYLLEIRNPDKPTETDYLHSLVSVKIRKSNSADAVFNNITLNPYSSGNGLSTPAIYNPGSYEFPVYSNLFRLLDSSGRMNPVDADLGSGPLLQVGVSQFSAANMDTDYTAKIRVNVNSATSTINTLTYHTGSRSLWPVGPNQAVQISQSITSNTAAKLNIAWDSSKQYISGDLIVYNNVTYQAGSGSLVIGTTPDTANSGWAVNSSQNGTVDVVARNQLFQSSKLRQKIKYPGKGIKAGTYLAKVEESDVVTIEPQDGVKFFEEPAYLGATTASPLLFHMDSSDTANPIAVSSFSMVVIIRISDSKHFSFRVNSQQIADFTDAMLADITDTPIPTTTAGWGSATYNTVKTHSLTSLINKRVVAQFHKIQNTIYKDLQEETYNATDDVHAYLSGNGVVETLYHGHTSSSVNGNGLNFSNILSLHLNEDVMTTSLKPGLIISNGNIDQDWTSGSNIEVYFEDTWNDVDNSNIICWPVLRTDSTSTNHVIKDWGTASASAGDTSNITYSLPNDTLNKITTGQSDNYYNSQPNWVDHNPGKFEITVKSESSLLPGALLTKVRGVKTYTAADETGYNFPKYEADNYSNNIFTYPVSIWGSTGSEHDILTDSSGNNDPASVQVTLDPFIKLDKLAPLANVDGTSISSTAVHNVATENVLPVKWEWGFDKKVTKANNYTFITDDSNDDNNGYYYNCMVPGYNMIPMYQKSDIAPFFNNLSQADNLDYNHVDTRGNITGGDVLDISNENRWLRSLLRYDLGEDNAGHFYKFVPASNRNVTEEDVLYAPWDSLENRKNAWKAQTSINTCADYIYEYPVDQIRINDIVYTKKSDEQYPFWDYTFWQYRVTDLNDISLLSTTNWTKISDYNEVLNYLNYNILTPTVVPNKGRFLTYDRLDVPVTSGVSTPQADVQLLNYSYSKHSKVTKGGNRNSETDLQIDDFVECQKQLLQLEYSKTRLDGMGTVAGEEDEFTAFAEQKGDDVTTTATHSRLAHSSITKIQLKNSHLPSHHRLRKIVDESVSDSDYNIIINDKVTVYANAVLDTEMPVLYYTDGMFFLENNNSVEYLPPQAQYATKLNNHTNSCFSIATTTGGRYANVNTKDTRRAFTGDNYSNWVNKLTNTASESIFLIEENTTIDELHKVGKVNFGPLAGLTTSAYGDANLGGSGATGSLFTREGNIIHSTNKINHALVNLIDFQSTVSTRVNTRSDHELYEHGLRIDLHPFITNFTLRKFFESLRTNKLLNNVSDEFIDMTPANFTSEDPSALYFREYSADYSGTDGGYKDILDKLLGSAKSIIFPELFPINTGDSPNGYYNVDDDSNVLGDDDSNSSISNIDWFDKLNELANLYRASFAIPDAVLSSTGYLNFWNIDNDDNTYLDYIKSNNKQSTNQIVQYLHKNVYGKNYLFDYTSLLPYNENLNHTELTTYVGEYIANIYKQSRDNTTTGPNSVGSSIPSINNSLRIRREYPMMQFLDPDKLLTSGYAYYNNNSDAAVDKGRAGVTGSTAFASAEQYSISDNNLQALFNKDHSPNNASTSNTYGFDRPLSSSYTGITDQAFRYNAMGRTYPLVSQVNLAMTMDGSTSLDINTQSFLIDIVDIGAGLLDKINSTEAASSRSSGPGTTIGGHSLTGNWDYINQNNEVSGQEFSLFEDTTAVLKFTFKVLSSETFEYREMVININGNMTFSAADGGHTTFSVTSGGATHVLKLKTIIKKSGGLESDTYDQMKIYIEDTAKQSYNGTYSWIWANSVVNISNISFIHFDKASNSGNLTHSSLSAAELPSNAERHRIHSIASKLDSITDEYSEASAAAITDIFGVSTLAYRYQVDETNSGYSPTNWYSGLTNTPIQFKGIITDIDLLDGGKGFTLQGGANTGGTQIEVRPDFDDLIKWFPYDPSITFTSSDIGSVSNVSVYRSTTTETNSAQQDNLNYWVGSDFTAAVKQNPSTYLNVVWNDVIDVGLNTNSTTSMSFGSLDVECEMPIIQFGADTEFGDITSTDLNTTKPEFFVYNDSEHGSGIWGLTLQLTTDSSKYIVNNQEHFSVDAETLGSRISSISLIDPGYGYLGTALLSNATMLSSVKFHELISYKDIENSHILTTPSNITSATTDAKKQWDWSTAFLGTGSLAQSASDLVNITFVADTAPLISSSIAALNNVDIEVLWDGGADASFTNFGSHFLETISPENIDFIDWTHKDKISATITNSVTNSGSGTESSTLNTWYNATDNLQSSDNGHIFNWTIDSTSSLNGKQMSVVFTEDIIFKQKVNNLQGVIDPDTSSIWIESAGNAYQSTAVELKAIDDIALGGPAGIDLVDLIDLKFDYVEPDTDTLALLANHVSELDPSQGTALTKYVTRNIKLKNSSNTLNIYLDTNRPSGTDIEVYYRTHTEDDLINKSNWILATPIGNGIPIQNNPEIYTEMEYVIDNIVNLSNQFTVFAIKIVFKSNNSSVVPKVKDLRAIALDV